MKKKNRKSFVIFIFVSILYIWSRTLSIENFPIYFFSDEAMPMVKAETLIKNHFKDELGNFLPPIFKHFYNYELGLTVYLNIPLFILFGKKIWAARFLTVFISLAGSIAITLVARKILSIKNYWAVLLFLSATPIFFLHSRTGFPTVIATSFYAIFLLFYFLYRKSHLLSIFPAIFFFTLSFYSYPGIWAVLISTSILLILVDLLFHLKHPKTTLIACLLGILLFAPLVAFEIKNSKEINMERHLGTYSSPIIKNIPLPEKLKTLSRNYLLVYNPKFLFTHDPTYHPRHYLKNYGYFPFWAFPFILGGLVFLILNLAKQPTLKIILITLLTAPFGSMITSDPGASRIMPIVIPMAFLFSLGVLWIEKTFKNLFKYKIIPLALFGFLTYQSVFITADSIRNGPLWFKNYGLYGMQYGAKQIFSEILPKYLKSNEFSKILVTPNWANGAEIYPQFFLSDKERERVEIRNIDFYTREKRQNIENNLFVMTKEEYDKTVKSPYFTDIKVKETLSYPDGSPGFYIVKLQYVKGVDSIFTKEAQMRKIPDEEEFILDGQPVKLLYSKLGDGQIKNLFDNNTRSLIRGLEANPYILTFTFPTPRDISGISLDLGSMDFDVKIMLFERLNSPPVIVTRSYSKMPDDPHIDIFFERRRVRQLRIEIKDINRTDIAEIHIRELKLL